MDVDNSSNHEQSPGAALSAFLAGTDEMLFHATAVAVATYSGTPIAGFLLMAVNYRRLGQTRRAVMAVMLGLLATGLVVMCWVRLPFFVSIPVCLGLLLGTRAYAGSMQGAALAQHVSRGGRLGSKWVALGVGLGCLAALLMGLRALIYFSGIAR